MKKKKSLLSLGILALVLVLGVGYAVVSNVGLTFDGTATVADADLKVSITGVQDAKTGDAEITHSWKASGEKADTFEITKMVLNETVTITYTVTNEETDVTANLAEKTALTNSNTAHFSATYSIPDEGKELAPGESTTVTVTVTLDVTPTTQAESSTEIGFALEASPKE